jgi:hypothetical protein
MVARAGEISHITGCTLRYTDRIPVVEGVSLPGSEEIGHLLSGRFHCSLDTAQNEIVLIRTKIPGTAGAVCSIHPRPGTPGWTLIFTMKTEGPARFVSSDSVLDWFDDARAGIHELFDLIVPEEIVQALR